MADFTPNMNMTIPVEGQSPWTEQMNGNLSIIDAVLGQFIAIPNFQGAWHNSIAYTVGQLLVEIPASTIWQCNVAHSSAASPTTFAQDRTAHPTYWTLVGGSGFVIPDAVKKSGDTMTGLLTLTGGLVVSSGAIDFNATASHSVGGDGWIYSGLTGGTHAVGFVWTGTQLDVWADGVRIGEVTVV